jgi:exoribonuclease R
VLAAAEQAAASSMLPDLDRTDIAFITIDPEGSMDLDQAMSIERLEGGYRVYYAIADVAAFVAPGGPIDLEAHRRGQTLYAPDHRVPLHPPTLSEGAASLLPDQVRPALLWAINLDQAGERTSVDVRRARVKSRRKLSYVEADGLLAQPEPPEVLTLLKEVGLLRLERERARGGVSLPLPDQEVVVGPDGWSLDYRRVLPIEDWNAQISLLTGMAAASIMLDGKVGLLRTLPPATQGAIARLRRTAAALKVDWPAGVSYADFVRSLNPNTPTGAAMLNACASLLRGAGYVAFNGSVPDHVEHAAIAADYAHVTAPLRRLVDRYAGEVAIAVCAQQPVPDWALSGLTQLPAEMQGSDASAKKFERAILDLVEAGLLQGSVGEDFTGAVIDLDDKDSRRGSLMLHDPAVEARVTSSAGALPLGQDVRATLVEADIATRRVRFELT